MPLYIDGVEEGTAEPYGPLAPVPILQHREEFQQALCLYQDRAPARVLELGTYTGGTLFWWLQEAAQGATVVSLDRYLPEHPDNRDQYASWVPEGVTLHTLQGDSHALATRAKVAGLGPYDWVFVDAGHLYPQVLADWIDYREMVRPGGVVLFHDIILNREAHPEIEVGLLWAELRRSRDVDEIIADPDAEWGGIGVVYL